MDVREAVETVLVAAPLPQAALVVDVAAVVAPPVAEAAALVGVVDDVRPEVLVPQVLAGAAAVEAAEVVAVV